MEKPEVLRLKSADGEVTVHYPALYEGLPDQYRIYAKRVLNETDDTRVWGLQRLKDYMKRENLTCNDDNYLLSILRSNKYNFAKIEAKLKKSLASRQLVIDMVTQIDSSTLEAIIDDMPFNMLPYRDKHGRMMFYTRPNFNLDKYHMDEVCYCGLAGMLLALTAPMTSINGWVHIGDCKTPAIYVFYPMCRSFKKIGGLLDHLSYRLGRLDVINEFFLAKWCLLALRPFLPDKINKRISFHGSNMKTIHKLYHPDLLPEEVGGNAGPITNKHYKERLLDYIEKLKKEKMESMCN